MSRALRKMLTAIIYSGNKEKDIEFTFLKLYLTCTVQ